MSEFPLHTVLHTVQAMGPWWGAVRGWGGGGGLENSVENICKKGWGWGLGVRGLGARGQRLGLGLARELPQSRLCPSRDVA